MLRLLTDLGYDVKQNSSKTYSVLTDSNRVQLLTKIASEIDGVYNRTPSSKSSVGFVEKDGFRIFVKPKSKQGKGSAGIENEINFSNKINSWCESYGVVDVFFESSDKVVLVSGIIGSELCGTVTAGRKKADILLSLISGNTFPISLKKTNAETWESADNYMGETAKKVLEFAVDTSRTTLLQTESVYKIDPSLAFYASEDEKRDVVFGSDLLDRGIVIKQTFHDEHFKPTWLDYVKKVECGCIMYSLEDIKGENDVWFLVRNDSTRNNQKLGYRGLRILAVYQSRITDRIRKVDRCSFDS